MNEHIKEESEGLDFTEWNEVMPKRLAKLVSHCDKRVINIKGFEEKEKRIFIDALIDFGYVLDIVTSKSGKKYFVIAEFKRGCVSFVLNDDSSYNYKFIFVGRTVCVKRTLANEIESLKAMDIYDHYGDEIAPDGKEGIVAKFIFRNGSFGKREYEYFIDTLKINNIECDFDESEDSDSSDTSDDDDSSDNENNLGHIGINGIAVGNNMYAKEKKLKLLQNVFYNRKITPICLLDCRSRDDAFYARENVPFIWLPQHSVSRVVLGHTSYMEDVISWKIPINVISQTRFELPKAKYFRGCFVDSEYIFLPLAQHSLAQYSGFSNFSHKPFGRDIASEETFFDNHLQKYFVRNAVFGSHPPLFIPIANGLFEIKLDPSFSCSHFYKHFNKLCYIYDRYGVINGKPKKDVAYPIKINKDFQDGKYITVVEICPLSKKGFMPRKVEMEISGEGFVANDEIIFCKQHGHIPIYYSKDQFKHFKLGTFGQIYAIYDPKLQQYSLCSFDLNKNEEKLEPLFDTKQNDDKKCTFHIPIKVQNGLLVSEFFGVISVKPFRKVDRDYGCNVFYVGNDPKYQTPFAEDEEYILNDDYDSDGVYFPPNKQKLW